MRYVKLPDTELDVMMVLWKADGPVSASALQAKLAGKHDWSISTVYTMLARLEEKGYAEMNYNGRYRFYSPIITKDEYANIETNSILNRLFEDSPKKFIASMINSKNISEEQFNELSELFKKGSGDK